MPSQAANSRPERNRLGSVTVAAIALAPMIPTPGTVASRRLTRLLPMPLASCASISRILATVSFNWATIELQDRPRQFRQAALVR